LNIYRAVLARDAKKDLEKVPTYIAIKLYEWIEAVAHDGLIEVRKISGFHDEPLKGKRKG
jgi:proteic killer suppression protein